MTKTRIEHHRPQYPDQFGQFRRAYHLEMVADRARTEAIYSALQRCLRADMVFCELGCGSGIFSVFAAHWCRKVYAVEQDPAMVEVAARNVAASRHAGKIHLVHGDARDVALPERADLVFCEMMSIWGVEEPQVPVVNHARAALLKPGGVALPLRIVNLVELGHYNFRFRDAELKSEMPLFTGVPRPVVFTERKACRTLDFSGEVGTDLSAEVMLPAQLAGTVNCAVLHSYVQMGPEVGFSGSDSLMPPTVVPLADEVAVRAGEVLRFRASVQAWSDLGGGLFAAELA
jgi:predicted RNA methylase